MTITIIGFIFKKATATKAKRQMIISKGFFTALFASEITAVKIVALTTARIALKAYITYLLPLNLSKIKATKEIIIIDGVMTPRVENKAPKNPLDFFPTKVDKFTAKTPGVH